MIIWGIIAIAILIVVHEAGHFVAAKSMGVGVEAFSVGFGPILLRKKIGETEYRLSLVPLGGYVKLVGENDDAESSKEAFSFSAKPVWRRAVIIAAGPITNLVTAVGFFVLSSWIGIAVLSSHIGTVLKDSPAYNAGIQKGDRIIKINGINVLTFKKMASIIKKNPGKHLRVLIDRSGTKKTVIIIPGLKKLKNIFGEEKPAGFIGVMPYGDKVLERYSFFSGIKNGVYQSYRITYLTIESLIKLVDGEVSVKQLGGPVMIIKIAGNEASAGAGVFLFFLAIIGINLGILNLLPIPILDGGHLFFLTIEAIRGKKLSDKAISISQQVGLSLLILLMVFATYNDLMRFFPHISSAVNSLLHK